MTTDYRMGTDTLGASFPLSVLSVKSVVYNEAAGFGSVGDDGVQSFWTTSRMVEDPAPTDYDEDYYFRTDTQTANASFSYTRPTLGRHSH